MNVYDAAHELSKAIKENPKYKKFAKLNKEIMSNESYADMVKLFQNKEIELQNLKSKDETVSKELIEEIQDLYSELNSHDRMKEYFKLEIEINEMMSDITKILKNAIDIEY